MLPSHSIPLLLSMVCDSTVNLCLLDVHLNGHCNDFSMPLRWFFRIATACGSSGIERVGRSRNSTSDGFFPWMQKNCCILVEPWSRNVAFFPWPLHPSHDDISLSMSTYYSLHVVERLKELETKTGYSKVYFFLVAVVLLSLLIVFAGGIKLVTDLLGFLYPAYMSFKSMESNTKGGTAEDATQWLTYWVVFSSLTVIEGVAGFIVSWIPMYFFFKIGLIVWLYHPSTKGAETVYGQVVRPFILPYLELAKTTTKKVE